VAVELTSKVPFVECGLLRSKETGAGGTRVRCTGRQTLAWEGPGEPVLYGGRKNQGKQYNRNGGQKHLDSLDRLTLHVTCGRGLKKRKNLALYKNSRAGNGSRGHTLRPRLAKGEFHKRDENS